MDFIKNTKCVNVSEKNEIHAIYVPHTVYTIRSAEVIRLYEIHNIHNAHELWNVIVCADISFERIQLIV